MNAIARMVPVGSLSLLLPPGTQMTTALNLNLALAANLDHEGYGEIAQQHLDRIAAFLRTPAPEPAPWYILRTATRREDRASKSLTELKVEHYIPMETVKRQLGRCDRIVDRPLFPGYLFARLTDDLYHDATHADGVHAAVMMTVAGGDRIPRRVPAGLVAALRARETAREFDRTIEPAQRPLEIGDSVRVMSGPYEALIGAIIEKRNKDRIALLLNSRIVEVELSSIELYAA